MTDHGDRPTDRPTDHGDHPTDRPGRSVVGLVDQAYAVAVLAAPLLVAGWFQAHAIRFFVPELPLVAAVGFTLAWEGAAGYVARLYLRALLRGDSTIVLRAAMTAYASASCGLLWAELRAQGKPPWVALAVGALTASGIFLWSRRARDLHRAQLHAMGLVDAQVVRFGLASWAVAPVETLRATRYAIRHRISSPGQAIVRYRAGRQTAETGAQPTALVGQVTDQRPQPDRCRPTVVDRPGSTDTGWPAVTDRPDRNPAPVGRPALTVVGNRPANAATANAATLRARYGDQLPPVGRTIRADLGWSPDRVKAAVAAYRRGDDLDQQGQDNVSA